MRGATGGGVGDALFLFLPSGVEKDGLVVVVVVVVMDEEADLDGSSGAVASASTKEARWLTPLLWRW